MPPIHPDETKLNELTRQVIGCGFTVLNTLGAGFVEKIYENALAHEIRKTGLPVAQPQQMTVTYDSITVGDQIADLIIDKALLVELKATKTLDDAHQAQCINDLKASGLPLALLMNFGTPKLQIKRQANAR